VIIAAIYVVAFLAIHLIEVAVAGAWNEIRSMVRRSRTQDHEPTGGKSDSSRPGGRLILLA
jgi:hypothetical protein